MSILVALILGIVQGLTEFLPVSSSGHLLLINQFFGIEGDFLLVSIILHLATLFAVVLVFYRDIWELIKHPFSKKAVNLYIATVPTVIIVIIFKKFIEGAFGDASLLPFCFMLTAVLLLITYLLSKKKVPADVEYEKEFDCNVKWTSALGMGISQGLAVIPGISRSGSTICTALLLGENRKESAKFSFLMSIPIILASMLYEIVFSSSTSALEGIGFLPLAVAFLSAFIVGVLSIKFMLKIVEKAKYYYFSIYLFVLSILSMIFI